VWEVAQSSSIVDLRTGWGASRVHAGRNLQRILAATFAGRSPQKLLCDVTSTVAYVYPLPTPSKAGLCGHSRTGAVMMISRKDVTRSGFAGPSSVHMRSHMWAPYGLAGSPQKAERIW